VRSVGRLRRTSIIGAALLAAVLLTTGCSVLRTGYRQAPTLAWWWLDRRVGFEGEQVAQVKGHLDAFFRWQRTAQLPELAALLDRAAREVTADVTPQQVCGWLDTAARHADAAVDRMLPDLAVTAATLTPAQIDRLERRFAEDDRKFRDEQIDDAAQALAEARFERAVERSERLYGRLGAAQRAQLERNVAGSPFDAALTLAERQARQREIVAALRRVQADRLDAGQTLAVVTEVVRHLRRSPRAPWRAYRERIDAFNCQAAARFHNATTLAQRRVAAERLAGWAADLRVLAAEDGAAAP